MAANTPVRVKAVILDIDGTLLLSNDAHARAYVEAARQLGIQGQLETIRRLIGKGGDKLIPEGFGVDAKSNTGKKLDSLKKEIFNKEYLPKLQAAPGSRALVARLRQEGIKLVVATSASKDEVLPLLEQAGVADLIEEKTSSDDAAASKPDPDIIEAALARIDEAARTAIMLGDTPYDVEAASRAGVRIIAVRCGGWSDHDLRGAGAVYDDPADVLTHVDKILAGFLL